MVTVELRTPEIKSLIVKLYKTLPKPLPSLLLLGQAGIGKSEVVRQCAEELANLMNKQFVEYEDSIAKRILQEPERYFVFVDLRLSECEPSDLIGIPKLLEEYYVYSPPLWAKVLSKASGILFLDELTNVQRDDIKSIAYKLILDRSAGFVKFHKDVLIISAGNTSEHSSIANPLPAPLLNRCLIIYAKAPTIDEWYNYMISKYQDNWCKRVYAYLITHQSDFVRSPDAPEGFNNFATPRTWTKLALVLTPKPFEVYSENEIKSLCTGFLGEEVGLKFFKFLKYQVPSIEEILENPTKYKTLDLDVKAIFVVEFAEFVKRNKEKIFRVKGVSVECDVKVKRLIETIVEDSEELALLMIQSLGTAKYEITAKILLSVPVIKEFLKKLKELRESIEKQLGRPVE